MIPTTPFAPDGQTIEPSVSVPTAATARSAAATTPEPELEPHGFRSRTYGMFVWPPMPLQPLDDGPDRKLAHSDRLALPMMMAPAAFRRCTINASAGVLPASAQEPAVVGMPVVSTLSLTMIGIPSSGRRSPLRPRRVGRLCVGHSRRADRDHRIERRVELADALEIEVRQSDGVDLPCIHQLLELRDRRRVDVDTVDRGASDWPRGRSAPRRRMPRARGQAGS